MTVPIWINNTLIQALNFQKQWVQLPQELEKKRKISFDFNVTSEEYHDIATLLYQMKFHIRIPDLEWSFAATIANYSTSITDLYKPNQVANYHLELMEYTDYD